MLAGFASPPSSAVSRARHLKLRGNCGWSEPLRSRFGVWEPSENCTPGERRAVSIESTLSGIAGGNSVVKGNGLGLRILLTQVILFHPYFSQRKFRVSASCSACNIKTFINACLGPLAENQLGYDFPGNVRQLGQDATIRANIGG